MFGYVIADLARLDEGQQTRYKSFYCGLCRALYRGYGPVPALALTYDMAFLTLFLSALYEPAEQSGASRCLRHPAQAQSWTQTAFTGYAAAMNCLLAYENRRDDWHDDQKLSAAAAAGLLGPGAKRAAAQYPEKAAAIRAALQRWHRRLRQRRRMMLNCLSERRKSLMPILQSSRKRYQIQMNLLRKSQTESSRRVILIHIRTI